MSKAARRGTTTPACRGHRCRPRWTDGGPSSSVRRRPVWVLRSRGTDALLRSRGADAVPTMDGAGELPSTFEGGIRCQYDEFIAQVGHHGGPSDRTQADAVTRTVLTDLGKRLQADEANDLAAQLPGELSESLTVHSDAVQTTDDVDD